MKSGIWTGVDGQWSKIIGKGEGGNEFSFGPGINLEFGMIGVSSNQGQEIGLAWTAGFGRYWARNEVEGSVIGASFGSGYMGFGIHIPNRFSQVFFQWNLGFYNMMLSKNGLDLSKESDALGYFPIELGVHMPIRDGAHKIKSSFRFGPSSGNSLEQTSAMEIHLGYLYFFEPN